MKRLGLGLAITGVVLLLPSPVLAGKVDDVKKAIKEKCGKDVPSTELLDAVVKAYDCQPEQDVSVADCTIKCLKGSAGKVVGE
jgi:hypothetical protein